MILGIGSNCTVVFFGGVVGDSGSRGREVTRKIVSRVVSKGKGQFNVIQNISKLNKLGIIMCNNKTSLNQLLQDFQPHLGLFLSWFRYLCYPRMSATFYLYMCTVLHAQCIGK